MTLSKLKQTLCLPVLLLSVLFATALPAQAVERVLQLEYPSTVLSGQDLVVVVRASTDAGNGEQVGFLHVEYSIDNGTTWTGICYVEKVGPQVMHKLHPVIGGAGSKVLVRARAAFRDGLAGDVDYQGTAIRWNETWSGWAEPPAKRATITVRAK